MFPVKKFFFAFVVLKSHNFIVTGVILNSQRYSSGDKMLDVSFVELLAQFSRNWGPEFECGVVDTGVQDIGEVIPEIVFLENQGIVRKRIIDDDSTYCNVRSNVDLSLDISILGLFLVYTTGETHPNCL